jgi:peptidyl-prolyl cis-trans isomerase C
MRNHSAKFEGVKGKWQRLSFLSAAVCFSLLLAAYDLGCRKKEPSEAEPSAPAQEAADDVLVTVNGLDITESQVEQMIEPELAQIAAKQDKLPPAFIDQFKKQLRQRALEHLIARHLMDEKVQQANIVVTEEEVTAQIRAAASTQKPPLSLEEFKQKLEKYGQNFEQLKHSVRKELSYQKLMQAQMVGKISVTEDDAKKYYSENQDEFKTPEQIRASHILIKPDTTDPNADPNEAQAKARAKAQNLLEQIKAGADFAELAKAHSGCSSSAQGGDLGFFGRGQMIEPFEKAAFELEQGKVSDIVETRYGYHIIKATGHKEPSVTPFEQAKDDIVTKLTQEKQREFTKEYIQSLKAEANIVYPPSKQPKPSMSASPKPALGAKVEEKTKPKELKKEAGRLSAIDSTHRTFTLKVPRKKVTYKDNVPGVEGAGMLTETYTSESIVFKYDNTTKVMKGDQILDILALDIDQKVSVEYTMQGDKRLATTIRIR